MAIMTWNISRCYRSLTARPRRRRQPYSRTARLSVEALEERTLPTVILSSMFNGLSSVDDPRYTPPDTSGAAGTDKYVETVNQTLRISNLSDGSAVATDTFDHFLLT